MESLFKDDILYMGLVLMGFVGERFYYTSIKLTAFRVLNCAIMVVLLVFAFANLSQAEFGMYVRNIQTIVSLFHMLFKYTLFVYYKSKIDELLIDRLKFWDYRVSDGAVIEATDRIYKIINMIQTTAVITSVVAVVMYFLKPLFNCNDVFIIDAWIFIDSVAVDVIVLACQYYLFLIITAIVIGYDSIYLSLCMHIVLQIRMLKRRLKRLCKHSTKSIEAEIGCCIAHHQFLISIFGRMRHVYSLTLLFHYFVTLLTGCNDLYELLIRKSDISYMLVMIVSLMFIYAQFGYYVLPADMVGSEFSQVSDSIYMSKWYEYSLKIQKLLLLIMAKSNRAEYFEGAGMIEISLHTYGSVVRKTFSFYAILRTLFNT